MHQISSHCNTYPARIKTIAEWVDAIEQRWALSAAGARAAVQGVADTGAYGAQLRLQLQRAVISDRVE